MFSRKEASRKTTTRSSTLEDVHDGDVIVLRTEFVPHSVNPAEGEEYWVAKCGMITSHAEASFPFRSRHAIDHNLPSRSTHSFLRIVREFCRISDEVEFRFPRHGEYAENPPLGYFTCYEAFLVRCRLW
ncbi:hypothetical protein DY000_02058494 [Brassica cretica]|uniref:Uncharacterized protein n=1 Tax=Brassica cretica TaxID=69181 RepID=A0ABQ7AYV6_BRACR|nr:hypothetical protein DY000_02058494 [Brassica cretica]